MIKLETAKQLKLGQIIHHDVHKNADGTCERWRVNGKPQVWKTRPDEVRVPVKYGLYSYSNVTEAELHIVHLEEDCPHA